MKDIVYVKAELANEETPGILPMFGFAVGEYYGLYHKELGEKSIFDKSYVVGAILETDDSWKSIEEFLYATAGNPDIIMFIFDINVFMSSDARVKEFREGFDPILANIKGLVELKNVYNDRLVFARLPERTIINNDISTSTNIQDLRDALVNAVNDFTNPNRDTPKRLEVSTQPDNDTEEEFFATLSVPDENSVLVEISNKPFDDHLDASTYKMEISCKDGNKSMTNSGDYPQYKSAKFNECVERLTNIVQTFMSNGIQSDKHA